MKTILLRIWLYQITVGLCGQTNLTYVDKQTFTFTFMHLADAFIQSDLHCIQVTVTCFPWESNP